ncbi:guanine deaminase [Salinisphaera sp. Q1T1-3]|uniref:guanine deaminase n=1 Tax=Salinisphaera sp. Q1T1-3 TaxID=2321229 RepID=UPI000E76309D|nr:guanine deaminase [Salinisphaera sp. Q1T1-3]RJS93798.1 guanine deaminase [Salinisphaera sp. Q1T1-3]
MGSASQPHAVRGTLVHCQRDPDTAGASQGLVVHEDGLLVAADGHIVDVGPFEAVQDRLGQDIPIIDHRGCLIVPGFVDTHIHYAQTDMIASYGEQLLTWLERYTFPAEAAFADRAVAEDTAAFFIDELLRNGTTSALVLGTVHAHSAEAIFAEAARHGMRLAAGKVLMDRNAPAALCDHRDEGMARTRDLIERWHGYDRLSYAITPRFAPACSATQLTAAGALAAAYPDTYIHTHLAENHDEIAWVAALFPESRSYFDVYDRAGLVRERAVFAHCLHMDDVDRRRMTEAGAVAVNCPTSNMFLGSGLFDFGAAHRHGTTVGLATDVGAGTSFSMLTTATAAYQTAQLTGQTLSPARMLYLATLAGAEALDVADRIGRLMPGYEADFVVLDPAATPLMARRARHASDIAARLFMTFVLGDDRSVLETWVAGQRRHRRAPTHPHAHTANLRNR